MTLIAIPLVVEERLDFHGANFKGLAAAGSVLTPQSFAATPVREGELPATIRDLITATQISGTDRFAFLRQTGRTNRAATVARGALKPTSDYEITRVEDRCRTVAHLSSPIQRQDLDDATTLQEFVSAELVYGLGQAVEDQLLNGNTSTAGSLDDLTGLLHTSGVAVAGWDSDLLTTTRKAVTAQQNLGNTVTSWVMNPSDWERFDLLNDLVGAATRRHALLRGPRAAPAVGIAGGDVGAPGRRAGDPPRLPRFDHRVRAGDGAHRLVRAPVGPEPARHRQRREPVLDQPSDFQG